MEEAGISPRATVPLSLVSTEMQPEKFKNIKHKQSETQLSQISKFHLNEN